MTINTPNSSAPFTPQQLDAAVALAQGAGVRGVIATYTWSTLEPTPGHIDVSSLKSGLDFYHQNGLQVLLRIQVINTVKREVPGDRANVAFDDPQFIARFHSLVSLAGDKPVVLQEAGYASGELNASSESAQQQFVTDLFQAWRAAGKDVPVPWDCVIPTAPPSRHGPPS